MSGLPKDKKRRPAVKPVSSFRFPMPEKRKLTNGIEVWGLYGGSQEITKIDFMFDAGTWYQPANLIAGFTNGFLNQGTTQRSAQQIAETFDNSGAYLHLAADQQFGNVSVLTLNKHFDPVLAETAGLIFHPTFPEKEISAQIAKKRQRFIVENKKVKVLARKHFSQVLFGDEHPYANTNQLDDYDGVTREALLKFHDENYLRRPCRIVVSGKYPENVFEMLDALFGQHILDDGSDDAVGHSIKGKEQKRHFVEKADALQCAIQMGRLVPGRNHPDFPGLLVLTTLLGGFFGSRLMANLREDKGYTYGIGANLLTHRNASYIAIMSEVGAKVYKAALAEIYYEIERLRNEPVGKAEMEVVRSYMLGDMLRGIDGIIANSESLKSLLETDMDFSFLETVLKKIQTIQPDEIQQLAEKYLHSDSLYEVVAGPVLHTTLKIT
ncbi:MAG: insulinase family protein [Prolixibacteraceae bacterium]|nr:insulinase family protein [Prolixibacteraceae bacterium]